MKQRTTQLILMVLSLSGWPNMASAQVPSIVSQPVSQVVPSGHAAAFAVQAQGAEPLSYQWSANGANIPCATNTTLDVDAESCTRAGRFQVTVGNMYGSVQSHEASLTVFSFSKTNAQVAEFIIWGPELKCYRVEGVSRLSASNLWEAVGAGVVPVNINTASTALLQQLPSIDPNLAQAIITSRSGPDGVEGTEDDTPFRNVQELNRVPGMSPEILALVMLYSTTIEPPVLVLRDATPAGVQSGLFVAGETGQQARFYRIVLLGDAFAQPCESR